MSAFNIGDRVSWKAARGTNDGLIEDLPGPNTPWYFIRRDNGNVLSLEADKLTLVKAAGPSKETLAAAIVTISEGVTALLKSGLNRKAIVILLAASTGVTRQNINAVLDGLATLKKDYAS